MNNHFNDQVIPLGHDNGTYYYWSKSAQRLYLLKKSQHNKLGFCALAPLSYFKKVYGTENGNYDVELAKEALIMGCKKVGIFDADRVRGQGCWIEGERLVANLGDKLLDGVENYPIRTFESDYMYESGIGISVPTESALETEYTQKIITTAKCLLLIA